MEYLERVRETAEKEVYGWQIYNYLNTCPIFKGGKELKSYEVETLFRESKRVWIVKVDTLSDGSEQLIVLRKKFDKPFKSE